MRAADADDRRLIAEALDDTLVVEAAAGTGKTTELVKRIVRLIETGRAAIDADRRGDLLREGRRRAEAAAARGTGAGAAARRRRAARRRGAARAAPSTLRGGARQHIHGFCADLLRERPVEARIDPSFAVLTEGQSRRLFDEAFADWLQRELERPREGVRRSLRRESKRNFGQDDDETGRSTG